RRSIPAHRDGDLTTNQSGSADRVALGARNEPDSRSTGPTADGRPKRAAGQSQIVVPDRQQLSEQFQSSHAATDERRHRMGPPLLKVRRTGMDFLILIKNGCDNLTATASPSMDALGLHMVLSLATVMLVWFGVQEALASAQGGSGFNVAKFLNFFLLITFAYCFVRFYDGSIPGIGYSLKGFVSGGTSSLVDYIGSDSTQEVQNTIHSALSKIGALSPSFTEPYTLLCTYTVQVILSILTALIGVIIAYGAIGATIVGLVGPVFIPWMVFDKTEFLFWG